MAARRQPLAAVTIAVLVTFLAPAPAGADDEYDHRGDSTTGTAAIFEAARRNAQSGRWQEAEQAYLELLDRHPGNVDYVFGYAQVLCWRGDVDACRSRLAQARRLAPDYEAVWRLELRAMLDSGAEPETLRAFAEAARQRFPDAAWIDAQDPPTGTRLRWELGGDVENLSGEFDDWSRTFGRLAWRLDDRWDVGAAVRREQRFGAEDFAGGAGVGFEGFGAWRLGAGIELAAAPEFLPARDLYALASRRLGGGWAGSVELRDREYATADVTSAALTGEKYVGQWRFAYSAGVARLQHEHAYSHRVTVNFYPRFGELALSIATGDEMEVVAPGDIRKIATTSVAVYGRIRISDYLSVVWRLGNHDVGDLYRRRAAGISIAGGY